ncbi:MAG: ATP-grasp domain-containing protein [Pseudomonadota bacterium]
MAHTTVLLTLGRLPKGLELARCLHRAGCRVVVADPFGSHLSKPSRAVAKSYRVVAPRSDPAGFRRDLLEVIRAEAVDLIIPVSEEVPYVSALEPMLPAGVHLLAPNLTDLMRLHDKLAFVEDVKRAGLNAPETMAVSDPAARALTEAVDYVVKPALGCSGTGLRFGARGTALTSSDLSAGNIVQKRVYGRELSSMTFAREGLTFGTVIYEGLTRAGTVAICFRRIDDAPGVEAWIRDYVSHTGHTGFIAFDLIVDDAGIAWPIECNPRLTSGLHFMDHDTLADAVLERSGQGAKAIGVKPGRTFQEAHTALTKTYAAIARPKEFFRRLGLLFSSRDVLWSWRDPLPFLLMTPMSWRILRDVIFRGSSFGEAATHDIEWPSEREPTRPSTETGATPQNAALGQ